MKKKRKKKIEKKVEKDRVIEELVKKTKPIKKDDKARQTSEYETKVIDVDEVAKLIAKNFQDIGQVKKKTKGITQSEDNSMILSKLSITTEFSIKSQFTNCWTPPIGLEYSGDDYLVTVKLDLEKDGKIKSREIKERKRMGIDSLYRTFAEAVDRAVLSCNPIRNLPVEKYENWSTMILKFNPEGMMVGE